MKERISDHKPDSLPIVTESTQGNGLATFILMGQEYSVPELAVIKGATIVINQSQTGKTDYYLFQVDDVSNDTPPKITSLIPISRGLGNQAIQQFVEDQTFFQAFLIK